MVIMIYNAISGNLIGKAHNEQELKEIVERKQQPYIYVVV